METLQSQFTHWKRLLHIGINATWWKNMFSVSAILFNCLLYHNIRIKFRDLLLRLPTVCDLLNPTNIDDANKVGVIFLQIEEIKKIKKLWCWGFSLAYWNPSDILKFDPSPAGISPMENCKVDSPVLTPTNILLLGVHPGGNLDFLRGSETGCSYTNKNSTWLIQIYQEFIHIFVLIIEFRKEWKEISLVFL